MEKENILGQLIMQFNYYDKDHGHCKKPYIFVIEYSSNQIIYKTLDCHENTNIILTKNIELSQETLNRFKNIIWVFFDSLTLHTLFDSPITYFQIKNLIENFVTALID